LQWRADAAEFEDSALVEEDITRAEIDEQDAVTMEVQQSVDQVVAEDSHDRFRDADVAIEKIRESTTRSILEHEDDAALRLEPVVQANDFERVQLLHQADRQQRGFLTTKINRLRSNKLDLPLDPPFVADFLLVVR
jgi:urease beta subunit